MMVNRFRMPEDLERLETYLRNQYMEHQKPVSWLPERLHDLLYRVGPQETDEGRVNSGDFIFLWEEDGEILGCVLPDGENVYFSLQTGSESLFPAMVAFSEKNCLPLFSEGPEGTVKFWTAVSRSLPDEARVLEELGYQKYPEEEYLVSRCPGEADPLIRLPEGFRFLYGEEYPQEEDKWNALRLGFHPEAEGGDFCFSMNPYNTRKQSSLYPDSFECLVVDESAEAGNPVCAYCFVYVDRQTKTALIEPVSTREQYQHRGLGTGLLQGALKRCGEQGVARCYVDVFGGRKAFYAAAGFREEDSIGFWYKTIRRPCP